MFFGTAILGLPGVLMGLAIGIGTIWDATTDPFVGHMSDNTRSRVFGKRHGYILFGCIAVAVVNYLLWSIPLGWSVWAKFGALTALLLVIETFNTVYSTPYGALGLDLAKSYNERTAIQGYKTSFSFLSLLVPSILMMVFLSPTNYITMGATVVGYQKIALFTGVLCVLCGLVCFFGTYKYRPVHRAPEAITYSPLDRVSLRCTRLYGLSGEQEIAPLGHSGNGKNSFKSIIADFFAILGQRGVKLLILGYAVSLSAGAFITSLGLHVFTFTFGFTTVEISVVMVCLIAGIVLGQPLWFAISKKRDKPTALLMSLGLVIVAILAFAVILCFRNAISPAQVMPLVAFVIFVCGVGTGCLYSLPISMFADMVDANNKKTGVDKTAKAAGFLTFCTKISNAFIMFVIGVSLDLVGFNGNSAVQSLWTQNWLGGLLVAGVGVARVFAIVIYSKISLSTTTRGREN